MSFKYHQIQWLHCFPSLFQCLTTLSGEEFFLVSYLNFPWCNLRPFLPVLSRATWEINPHIITLSDSSESKLAATSLLVQAWCHGWSCYLMYICCWQAFTGLFLVGCFPAALPLPAALQGLWPLNTCKALKGEHLGNKLIKGCSHVCSRKTALYSYRASKLG